MHDDAGAVIIGHRGAAGHAPENTEAALLAGIKLGAHALEVDVQFTSDGTPVIFHDRTLERMAGVRGRIRDQSARDLAGYDVGFRFGDEYRGLRILTLDEAIRLIPRGMTLHLEIKEYDTVTSSHLKEVLASLKRRSLLEDCVVSSFSEKILSTLRGLEPKLVTGLLVSGKARGAASRAAGIGCSSLHPETIHTDRALVEECHALGLRVFSYTANEPAQMKHLLDLGVDGLYTDFPGRLRELVGVQPKGSRSLPPRRATRQPAPRPHAQARRTPPVSDPGETAVETWTGEPTGEPSGDSPQEATTVPAATPHAHTLAAGTATEEEAARKKRRRGRRGGRRHRRKPGAAPVEGSGEGGSFAEEAPIEIPDAIEDGAADLAGAEPGTPSEMASPETPGNPLPVDTDAAGPRKRRRRGHRGGRRHRRGGSNGSSTGEAPTSGSA